MENYNICKNDIQFILDYNKNVIIKDPIRNYPESAIVISKGHYDVSELNPDINKRPELLIRRCHTLQRNGWIIRTIMHYIDKHKIKLKLLYKSLDYPPIVSLIDKYKYENVALMHIVERYGEFSYPNDKILLIPHKDDSYKKNINYSMDFNKKKNKCYWRGGCEVNTHLRHEVAKLLSNNNNCDVKIYRDDYPNTKISSNKKQPFTNIFSYKIILSIESIVTATDIESVLLLNAIPIIIWRWWKPWFYKYIEDNLIVIHYNELEKLPKIIDKLINDNDYSKEMNLKCCNFANKIFNKQFIKNHIENEVLKFV